MSLRLIVMRHAKSDWNAGAETDHERPLNERGRKEAPHVGKALKADGLVPEVVLSSDSTRTTETFEAMSPFLAHAAVSYLPELYHAGLAEVRAAAGHVPPGARTVMVLGHNPGWEDMVRELTGEPIELKTAHAAILESDAHDLSTALAPGRRMRLVRVLKP